MVLFVNLGFHIIMVVLVCQRFVIVKSTGSVRLWQALHSPHDLQQPPQANQQPHHVRLPADQKDTKKAEESAKADTPEEK